MNFSTKQRPSLIISSVTYGILLSASLFAAPALAAECDNIGRQLRGTNQALQGHGGAGMWGLMQQTTGYRDNAMTGMQIDSRLSLAVVKYETKCENGENPGKDISDQIDAFMDRTRDIKNRTKRGAPDKIISELKSLNSDLGKFLENLN